MPKQVLLADDSVTIHRMVEMTFAHLDYVVTTALTVEEALGKARTISPDIVLADAAIGAGTGYDLCRGLRQDSGLGAVPCLILSSNFHPYDEARGQEVGSSGALSKPFETQTLIDRVIALVEKRSTTSSTSIPRVSPPLAFSTPAGSSVLPPPPAPPLAMPAAMASNTASTLGASSATSPRLPQLSPTFLPPPPAPPLATGTPLPGRLPNATASTMAAEPALPPSTLRGTGATPFAMSSSLSFAPSPPAPAPAASTSPRFGSSAGIPMAAPKMPRPPLIPHVPTPVRAPPPAFAPAPASSAFSAAVLPSVASSGSLASSPPTAAAPASTASQPIAKLTMPAPKGTLMGIPALSPVPAPVVLPPSASAPPTSAPSTAITENKVDEQAVTQIAREVLERIAWEVVPELAEAIIREHVERLARERTHH